MNKKEVQNFIIWYIPAIIGANFITAALFLTESGGVSFGHRVDYVLSSLGYLVCGAWLFVNSPKYELNRWLWGVFGLGAHLFAIVLYFGYVAYGQLLKSNAQQHMS